MVNELNMLAWVTALESGEFQQGRRRLRRVDNERPDQLRYCCLGVANELANRAGVRPAPNRLFKCHRDNDEGHSHDLWCVASATELLPSEVVEWLGLGSEHSDDDADGLDPVLGWTDTWGPDPDLRSDGVHLTVSGCATASMLNDGSNATFTEIARRIRAVYLENRAPESWKLMLRRRESWELMLRRLNEHEGADQNP